MRLRIREIGSTTPLLVKFLKSLKNNHKNNDLNLGGIDYAIKRSNCFRNRGNRRDWC